MRQPKLLYSIGTSVPQWLTLLAVILGNTLTLSAVTTNFYTGFDASEGYTAGPGLVGQKGWAGTVMDENAKWVDAGSEGNGILDGFYPTLGQQAYVGLTPLLTNYGPLSVYKTFDPGTVSGIVSAIKFSTVMQVVDSINANYDYFYVDLFDDQDNTLFSIEFDNYSLAISYWSDAVADYVDTGKPFANNQSYLLGVQLNPSNSTWSATLGAVVLVTNQPIAVWSTNVSTIMLTWDQYDYAAPGDNYLVVDNLQVTTETSTSPVPPRPTLRVLSASAGGSTTLRLTGQEASKFAIDGSTNLVASTDWVPLGTNTVSGGFFNFTDTAAASLRSRNYRARWVP
jgi:hypothetical protein